MLHALTLLGIMAVNPPAASVAGQRGRLRAALAFFWARERSSGPGRRSPKGSDRVDELVWELAAADWSEPKDPVEAGDRLELRRARALRVLWVLLWVEDADRSAKLVGHDLDRQLEVGVVGDHYGLLEVLAEGIGEQ